jgi:hypothetical protein
MKQTQTILKSETLEIKVNGKSVTLIFSPEPNKEAAEFIKKTLINAYLIKAV